MGFGVVVGDRCREHADRASAGVLWSPATAIKLPISLTARRGQERS
jgi:hypothetical protein